MCVTMSESVICLTMAEVERGICRPACRWNQFESSGSSTQTLQGRWPAIHGIDEPHPAHTRLAGQHPARKGPGLHKPHGSGEVQNVPLTGQVGASLADLSLAYRFQGPAFAHSLNDS